MKNARKSPWRLLFKFHRYSGLSVAAIAIFLALTGIALNHTEDLELDSQFVQSELLLDWYGVEVNSIMNGYKTGDHWLSQTAGLVLFDQQLLFNSTEPLQGAIATDDFIVIAQTHSLTLLTPEGQLIERTDQSRAIEKLGINDADHIVIKSGHNNFRSNDGLLSWQIDASPSVTWSKTTRLPKALASTLSQYTRQHILPYERVMLDLHSGRLFGTAGVFIVDLSGVLLILLAISGTWMWLRHKVKSHYRKANKT